MKKEYVRNIVFFVVVFIVLCIILDYINLPTLLGLEMGNINWDFCMGSINAVVVITLYLITYKTLDRKTIQRENNKKEIAILLMQECYRECIKCIQFLDKETVEKYIVPKINFNNTDSTIIRNIQNIPFSNEDMIWGLIKDGQMTKSQIENYLKIKEKFSQYITMRITFFDAAQYYEPIKIDLCNIINRELNN